LNQNQSQADTPRLGGKSHMPSDSLFFEKIVPVILVVMGIVTVVLVLFAAGVLLGFIHF
jgi:hypothetical protein